MYFHICPPCSYSFLIKLSLSVFFSISNHYGFALLEYLNFQLGTEKKKSHFIVKFYCRSTMKCFAV